MTALQNRYKKLAVTLGLVSIMAVSAAVPAFAQDSVTQAVNAGTRSASVADATLTAVSYSHIAQNNTGALTLTADDSTGSDAGWHVSVLASDFVDGSNSIAASGFEINTANTPTANAGQAVDGTDGPKVASAPTGALNAARTVITANSGFGKGNYDQGLDVTLAIPGQTLAGSYVSTLTVSITAGPEVV